MRAEPELVTKMSDTDKEALEAQIVGFVYSDFGGDESKVNWDDMALKLDRPKSESSKLKAIYLEILAAQEEGDDEKNNQESESTSETDNGEEVLDLEDPDVFVVERLEDRKVVRGKKLYLVKWKGYPSSQNTWEVEKNIGRKVVEDFEKKRKSKSRKKFSTPRAKRSLNVGPKPAAKVKTTPETKVEPKIIPKSAEKPVVKAKAKASPVKKVEEVKTKAEKRGLGAKDTKGKSPAPSPAKKRKIENMTPKSADAREKKDQEIPKNDSPRNVVRVTGVKKMRGNLMLRVEYDNNESEYIPNEEAKAKYPHQVIAFYESHLKFVASK